MGLTKEAIKAGLDHVSAIEPQLAAAIVQSGYWEAQRKGLELACTRPARSSGCRLTANWLIPTASFSLAASPTAVIEAQRIFHFFLV